MPPTVASPTLTGRSLRLRNVTLVLGGMITILSAAVIAPSLPAVTATYAEIPNVELLTRLMLTMPALTIAITAPFTGYLLDRYGRRPVLLAALVLYGLAGTAGYFIPSLPVLLFSRALLGIAVAGTMSGFVTLIGDFFQGEQLNRFMGLQAGFNNVAGVVILLLAGVLAEANWRNPFLLYSIAFLILPLFWRYVPEPAVTQQRLTSTGPAIRERLPWLRLLPIYGVAFLSMALFYVVPVQLPFYLAPAGIGASGVGSAIAAMACISAVGSFLYRRVRHVMSSAAVSVIIFGFMALGFFIISLTMVYGVVVVGLVVAGVGTGFLVPHLNVWLVSAVEPAVRGRAVGGLSASFFLGQFTSPLLIQPVIDAFGGAAAFTAGALLLLLLALLFVPFLRRPPAPTSQP